MDLDGLYIDDGETIRLPRPDPADLAIARRDWMFGNYLQEAHGELVWYDPDRYKKIPEKSESYPSATLDDDGDSIRLLRLLPGEWEDPISCSLDIVKLSDKDDFEALSYTWGGSTERQSIKVNEESSFPVTDNAFSALRRFRYRDRHRILWIDAICIDQSNVVERMQQVSIMGKIYSGAQQCLIWLGEVPNASHDVSLFGNDDSIPRDGVHDVAMLKALDHIYWWAKPRWWERAWVVQETVLARHALVCFASFQIPWGVFCWDFLRVDTQEKPKRTGDAAYPSRYTTEDEYPMRESMRGRFESLAWFRVVFRKDGAVGGLRTVRVQMLSADCFDSRDKIYSVLSIIDPREAKLIQPDYTRPWVEVYARATYASILVQANFDILHLKGESSHEHTGLPSWSVNFSRTRTFEHERFRTIGPVDWTTWSNERKSGDLFQADLSPGAAYLTVRGYHFDQVVTKSSLHQWRPGNVAGSQLLGQLVDAVQSPKIVKAYRQGPHVQQSAAKYALVDGPIDDGRLESLRLGKRTSKLPLQVMHAFGLAFSLWSRSAGTPETLQDLQERDLFMLSRSETDVYRFWEYAEATASDAALITTEKGFIGLVPNNAILQHGLEVVLLHNCKMPVLLRPQEDRFEFVGFAYIHGIMYDELKSVGQDGALVERSFTLC